jgi:hypothetical protein
MTEAAPTATRAPHTQQSREGGTISAVLVGYDERTEQIRPALEILCSQSRSPAHK